MKAITIDEFGGVEKLKFADVAAPEPKEDEIQIKIAYTAVNPVDWKIREGYLKDRLPHEFPIILGWDAAGTVSKLGSNVKNFKANDEVYAYCRKPVVQWGTYAEYICIKASDAALKPKKLNFAQASAIPLAGLTAWQALFDFGQLKKGQTILIHAGAGGVGGFAIQFAKNAGAKVYTTASKANHQYVLDLGADAAICYQTQNFVDVIKKNEKDGLDVVFDTMGGNTLRESYDLVKPGGHILGIVEKPDPRETEKRNIVGKYIFVAPNGEELTKIAGLIDAGKIQVPEIHEFTLKEAAKAQEKSKEGHTKGKIVLKVQEWEVT